MKYLAFDADSAGQKVGRAVLSDDEIELGKVSKRIDLGQELLSKWVMSKGGNRVSGGGDEFTAKIPESALSDLEMVRKDYEFVTQFTVTVGVGDKLSEAGKALLVGKFRGKDQIVTYDPSIEEDLEKTGKNIEAGSASDEEKKLHELYLKKSYDLTEASMDETKLPKKQQKDVNEPEFSETKAPDSLCDDDDSGLCGHSEEGLSDDQCALCSEGDIEEGAESNDQDAEDEHAEQSDDGILEAVDGKLPEGETEQDIVDQMDDEDGVNGDFDGNISRPDGYSSNQPTDMGMDGASPVDHNEGPDDEEPDYSEVLHQSLDDNADSIQQEKTMAMVAEALQNIKNSKQSLEALQQQAPDAYAATISMMRAMIELAKKYAPQQQSEAIGDPDDGAPQGSSDELCDDGSEICEDDNGELCDDDSELCDDDDGELCAPGEDSETAPPQTPATPTISENKTVGQSIGKLPTKNTTKHVAKTPLPIGSVNGKGQKKVQDANGKVRFVNMKSGAVLGDSGVPVKSQDRNPEPRRKGE